MTNDETFKALANAAIYGTSFSHIGENGLRNVPMDKIYKTEESDDDQLVKLFGRQDLAPFQVGDLIDQDKLSKNDFFYFKQGYELGVKSLESKLAIAIEALEFYDYRKNWREQVYKFHSNWQAVGDMSRSGGSVAKEALIKIKAHERGGRELHNLGIYKRSFNLRVENFLHRSRKKMNEKSDECVVGCMIFHGGEIRHHEHCPFYPESLTERYANIESRLSIAIEALEFYAKALSFDDYRMSEDMEGDMVGRIYYGKRAREALGKIRA